MTLITIQTTVPVSTEALLSALDLAISDNSILPHDITNNLSPYSKRILLETLFKEDEIDIKDLLTNTQIEELQNEREIDVEEVLDNLDYDLLISHLMERRTPKEIICDLVEQL